MNLGGSPKKMAMYGSFLLLSLYSLYTNVLSGPDTPAGAQKSTATQTKGQPGAPTPAQVSTEQRMQQRKMMLGRQSVAEFRATMKCVKGVDCPDPMRVDPTLRLDLLAKLQTVTLDGGQRSLFELGQPPPPKPTGPDPKIDPKKLGKDGKPLVEVAKAPPVAAKPADPIKPPPPPIPLKFYGFTAPKSSGVKRAFFLEGEDIYVVNEGESIKGRYKVIQIKLTSAVVEDSQFKHQQTLPLEEPPVT